MSLQPGGRVAACTAFAQRLSSVIQNARSYEGT